MKNGQRSQNLGASRARWSEVGGRGSGLGTQRTRCAVCPLHVVPCARDSGIVVQQNHAEHGIKTKI